MNTNDTFVKKAKRRDIQIIAVLVLILTVITFRVSYSAFFTVQSLSSIQEIETGNLDVNISIDNTKSILNETSYLFPTTNNTVSFEESNYSTLTLENNGSINADFSVSVSYDYDALRAALGVNTPDEGLANELVSFQYLHIGVVEGEVNNWMEFGNDQGFTTTSPTINSFTASSDDANNYPILRNTVSAGTNNNKTYRIYIWLDKDTPTTEINKYVYLKLNVKCAAGDETIQDNVQVSNQVL